MPPKKTGTAAAKKSSTSSHASYSDMIKEAIINLKDRTGSSRQAIKKYVQANNNLAGVTDAQFTSQFNRALQKGSESGVFSRPKGPSGPVKLAAPKSASDSKPKTATKTKKAGTKTTTKKAPAAKKASTTKKTTTAKKATTTKSKANTSKVRKTPAAAPAVAQEKAPVVIAKTKSGRVSKSKAPQPTKATAAKSRAAPKKAAPKKATPKKA